MARTSVGTWFRNALGKSGGNSKAKSVQPGSTVLTNTGTVMGTVASIWHGADATDGSVHEDTILVQKSDGGNDGLLYIPASAVASMTEKGVVLTVDTEQVAARGWRFRPIWMPVEG